MAGYVRDAALAVELDVQRRPMRGERQARADGRLLARGVAVHRRQLVDSERLADLQPRRVREGAQVPRREARRVPKVGALHRRGRAVEVPQEIELLARVVVVDVDAVTDDVVDAVLDGPDAACHRLFRNADAVAQAPAHQRAARREGVGAGDARDVEGADLAVAGRDVAGGQVDVGVAATADEQHAVDLLGGEHRAGVVVRVVHALD